MTDNHRDVMLVDFDGTLATYDGWQGAKHAGEPIPAMVERVKQWLDEGKDVRIFTSRVAPGNSDAFISRQTINKWSKQVFGRLLPITATKDAGMVELWDDRAHGVETNTGRDLQQPTQVEADTGEAVEDKPLNEATVCLIDNGLLTFMAEDLAEHFGKVLYFMGHISAFPKSNITEIGTGLKGVERIDEQKFWQMTDANQIDRYVCPDTYYGGLQTHLAGLGKRVWGSRLGENLELDRVKAKELIEQVGLPSKPYKVVIGLDNLRAELKRPENEGSWVKISYTRGDGETRRNESYALSETWLDEWAYRLGALKDDTEFIIEPNIDGEEIGFDGYIVDGQFPENMLLGIEVKDSGYACAVIPTSDAPPPILEVNEKLADYFREHQYRGFFSDEIRVEEDGTGYLTDPTTRAGSPPSQLYFALISNLAEVLWKGAMGEFVEPEYSAKYGVLAFIQGEWAKDNWQPIEYPDEIAPYVKLRNKIVMDGKTYVIPEETGMQQVGAVIATGDTLIEAIELLVERAGQIKGYQLNVQLDSIPRAMGEVQCLVDDYGYSFGDGEIPTPEEVQGVVSK